jgi:predicted dehydrogenase
MKNNRRKFLANAGRVTLAFTIVPRFVLGGKGWLAPSDRIQLGFIGTGKQGRGLLDAFADKASIVAGADADAKKLAQFQSLAEKAHATAAGTNTHKGFRSYAEFQELLERKDIDAVVIATPDHWHAVQTVMAANAGKHVYCEKPLAHSIEEGRAMVNAMTKNKKILQTGSMQRSWKNFRQACELVRNGYIGNIKEVLVNVGDAAIPCDLAAETVPGYLHWESWVGPASYRAYNAELSPPVEKDIFPNWRLFKEYGGGSVSDWGAHMFDIAQWGLGMDKTGPVKFLPPEGNAVKGLVMVYENGLQLKHQDFGRGYGVRFIGDRGSIDISRDYLDSNPVNVASASIKPGEKLLYNSDDHYIDWLNCIKTGKQPICDAETGHRTSSVCCLANIAYWLRKPLDWNPVTEQVTNSEEANRLTRAYIRATWKLI